MFVVFVLFCLALPVPTCRAGSVAGAISPVSSRLAVKLASKAPQAMRRGLEAVYAQSDMDYADALSYLGEMLIKAISTDDAREGLMSFMEKRPPKWPAR